MNKVLNYIFAGLFLLLLIASFIGGYKYYPLRKPCPQIVSDTVYVYDTVVHYIPDTIPWYIYKKDTVIVTKTEFKDVDTAAILQDYYAIHYYNRIWEDSLVKITLEDAITENRPLQNIFKYQMLKPQTVIENKIIDTRYSRYLYAGLNVPINKPEYMSIDLLAAGQKCYLGVGYSPGMKSINVKGGVKLFQFRE